ncbi:ABC transporter permease [Acidobacterium sp. S8]|uniref:ABC transporter permease n=1 Tax=Acidobacterium sp. S8 TaxID=1641854 RepID=UPI0020B168F7|nr:ABC transporter permease [Acidobacterium sp. S8]
MGWLRRLFFRERLEADLDKELRFHFESQVADKVRSGIPESEARRLTRIEFGGIEQIKEDCRERRGTMGLESLLQDVRYALRQLRKSPGFTLTAVLTLALGIGATTAIFTLVQQVMLQSLPVNRPDQLWRIGDQPHCCDWAGYSQDSDGEAGNWSLFSWEAYKLFRANTPGLQALAALQAGNMPLGVRPSGSSGPPDKANGQYVSGNFFQTLGVSAWRGRLFVDADDLEGAPPVAVMSFHAWQEKYGSDPSVVGSAYQINGRAFTIIGVAPAGFVGAKMTSWGLPDIWMPLATEPLMLGKTARIKNTRTDWLDLIGRLRPGTNPKALQVHLQGELQGWLASHLADMSPQEEAVWQKQTLRLSPGGAGFSILRRDYSESLLLLMFTACCVLLVACANIANLLLARGLKNQRQTAVRVALGASRRRLVRNALLESVTLSLIGGAAGVAVAWAGARLILYLAFHMLERSTWIPVQATPSTLVLLFALGVAVLTGVIFGIAPAWMTSHAEPVEAMRGANREVGGGRHWAQKALVIAQAAVSLVLLSAAAMLGGSLQNLEHQNFGFDPDGRYLASIGSPMLANYKQEQLVPLYRQIQDRLSALPRVRNVSAATYAPMAGNQWGHDIRVQGKPEPGPKDDVSADWTRITPGFFDTIGARMLAGRAINEDDNANARHVAVINQAFARKFFENQNPVGRHFGPASVGNAGTYEIVGVVQNIHYVTWGFRDPARAMYYIPQAQTVQFDQPDLQSDELWSQNLYNIVIWAPEHPANMLMQVKKVLSEVDPNLVMYDVQSYSRVIQGTFDQQNMIASLTWLFGAVGLVLAAVGLYGVTAYGVEQRRSEIGVRMALGADRGSVVAMVLREAFWQVSIGLGIGIPAASGTGYLMTSQLFGVTPWNPLLLAGTAVLLGSAALVTAVIPARKAASTDPMQALRSE